jgi:hypothetical protein
VARAAQRFAVGPLSSLHPSQFSFPCPPPPPRATSSCCRPAPTSTPAATTSPPTSKSEGRAGWGQGLREAGPPGAASACSAWLARAAHRPTPSSRCYRLTPAPPHPHPTAPTPHPNPAPLKRLKHLDQAVQREYTTAMRVTGKALDGQTIQAAGLRGVTGLYLFEIHSKDGEVAHAVGPDTVLHEGDVLYFAGEGAVGWVGGRAGGRAGGLGADWVWVGCAHGHPSTHGWLQRVRAGWGAFGLRKQRVCPPGPAPHSPPRPNPHAPHPRRPPVGVLPPQVHRPGAPAAGPGREAASPPGRPRAGAGRRVPPLPPRPQGAPRPRPLGRSGSGGSPRALPFDLRLDGRRRRWAQGQVQPLRSSRRLGVAQSSAPTVCPPLPCPPPLPDRARRALPPHLRRRAPLGAPLRHDADRRRRRDQAAARRRARARGRPRVLPRLRPQPRLRPHQHGAGRCSSCWLRGATPADSNARWRAPLPRAHVASSLAPHLITPSTAIAPHPPPPTPPPTPHPQTPPTPPPPTTPPPGPQLGPRSVQPHVLPSSPTPLPHPPPPSPSPCQVPNSAPVKRNRMYFALALVAALVATQIAEGASGKSILHLWPGSVIVAGVMLAARCLNATQARRSMDWEVRGRLPGGLGVQGGGGGGGGKGCPGCCVLAPCWVPAPALAPALAQTLHAFAPDRRPRPSPPPPTAAPQVYICIAFAFAVSTAMEKTNVALAIAELFATLSEPRGGGSRASTTLSGLCCLPAPRQPCSAALLLRLASNSQPSQPPPSPHPSAGCKIGGQTAALTCHSFHAPTTNHLPTPPQAARSAARPRRSPASTSSPRCCRSCSPTTRPQRSCEAPDLTGV